MKPKPKPQPKSEQDNAWKDMLDAHFAEFIAFFFPGIHAEIDWSRGHVFLDKELAKLGRGHAQGGKLADKLAQVWLKNGVELLVLLHVEVQGEVEPEFNRRVYVYNYKIVDRCGGEVVSLVVLTGATGKAEFGRYETARWGCRLVFEYPFVRLTDWRGRETELLAHANPFALVVLAQLRLLAARGEVAKKYAAKRGLIALLKQQGYQRAQVISLLRFIDWIIALPQDLEDSLEEDIVEALEEKKMPYIASWERRWQQRGEQRGEQRGIEIGEKRGKLDLLLPQLKRHLGEVETELKERIEALSAKQLDKLAVALFDFTQPADLERWLKRQRKSSAQN
jgi:hypothetical protein